MDEGQPSGRWPEVPLERNREDDINLNKSNTSSTASHPPRLSRGLGFDRQEDQNRVIDGSPDDYRAETDGQRGLRQFLDFDLPKGITFLVQAARTLDAYSETHEPKSATTSAPEAQPPP